VDPAVLAHRRPGVVDALERVRAGSPQAWRVAVDPYRGVPSTVSMRSPLGGDVTTWLRANSRMFGFADVTTVLRLATDGKDAEGGRHLWYEQVTGDAAVDGTTVVPLTGDDAVAPVALPFAFRFYGTQ
jgi:hypothetical protein